MISILNTFLVTIVSNCMVRLCAMMLLCNVAIVLLAFGMTMFTLEKTYIDEGLVRTVLVVLVSTVE
jgi:hypothetical protein